MSLAKTIDRVLWASARLPRIYWGRGSRDRSSTAAVIWSEIGWHSRRVRSLSIAFTDRAASHRKPRADPGRVKNSDVLAR